MHLLSVACEHHLLYCVALYLAIAFSYTVLKPFAAEHCIIVLVCLTVVKHIHNLHHTPDMIPMCVYENLRSTPFVRTLALQSFSRSCSPAPDLVL